ncbi:MAG TPA: PDGLE domain-containing protein [candidate division Zixibacteria bacterium]|nr:PDGLE domain-containing protein [candidate division Zixibacteria bacterium]
MSRLPRHWWIAGLALAAAIVVVLAPLASSDPDGLERVATDHGFADRAQGSPLNILGDYLFPGVDGPLSTILAGLIGVAIVFVVMWVVARLLARREGQR